MSIITSPIIRIYTLATAKALSAGVTAYTNSFLADRMRGFVAAEIKVSGASPSVTITQQCSVDNTTWYDPTDATGAALGTVCTALTASGYRQVSPVICKYIRYKLVPVNDTTLTYNLVSQE